MARTSSFAVDLLRSLGVRVRKNGVLRVTDPQNQAIVKASPIYHISKSWTSKKGGLAKCIVFVEAATLVEFVTSFNEYGTPNHFSAKRSTLFCTDDIDVPYYQMYCMSGGEALKKIRKVIKVVRPSTVPKMVLFFEVIVRMFTLQNHVNDIVRRTATVYSDRYKAGT